MLILNKVSGILRGRQTQSAGQAQIPDESFEGTIISDPKTIEDEYQQIMEKIEELMEQQESEETEETKQESEDGTMLKSLTGLNQTPWPAELVPGIPAASNLVHKVY